MTEGTGCEKVAAVDARVVRVDHICREHVAIDVTLRQFPPSEPGQFLELRCHDEPTSAGRSLTWPSDGFPSLSGPAWDTPQPYLRRPFSIADHRDAPRGAVHLTVISRTVGRGTQWLERLRPGDDLNLTGPLGRGFAIPEANVPIVLVGGGVGIPPLLYLTRRLHERGYRDVLAIFGAARADLLPVKLLAPPDERGVPRPCLALPGGASFPAIVTTDDGSAGLRGLATDGLRLWHAQRGEDARRAVVVVCGPDAMLRAAARLTSELGMACQLCIERNMACGLGTCLSCVVRVRDAARPAGWRWALACTDGPVFPRDELFDYCTLP